MMRAKELAAVIDAIESEGFDYAFKYWSTFDQIKDEEFHRLRTAYIGARDSLAEYIGLDD